MQDALLLMDMLEFLGCLCVDSLFLQLCTVMQMHVRVFVWVGSS